MRYPKPVTIDFETLGIESRPQYPPKPVGVGIKHPGKPAKYYAWGHPSKNNCGITQAAAALKQAWKWKDGLLFQNGKFDVDVAETHMRLPLPGWERIHDTMFLLFLDNPNETELGLKPSAERLLGLPPEERDAVGDWLLEHQPVPGVKISRSRQSPHYFGRYIAYAPGDLVGRYCAGDVDRTWLLFELLYPQIVERNMLKAYDRERELMPVLLSMEREGLPVNAKRLGRDITLYTRWMEAVDKWIYRKLRRVINIDSGEQLVDAMIRAGLADPGKLPRTPKTGKFQANKLALLASVKDKALLHMLKYRSQLGTCLSTFMLPWHETASRSNGLIYTTWNQVKSPKGDDAVGARTGRLSSTPNFQNVPKVFAPLFKHNARRLGMPELLKELPKCPVAGLPALPSVRDYVTPFPGEILLVRDYSQQELRILAHFEDGNLMDQYVKNPWTDMHDNAKEALEKLWSQRLGYQVSLSRRSVKNTNFGLIYGMGAATLALRNDQTVEEAKAMKRDVLQLYSGIKEMYADMRQRAKDHKPLRTWGGREYYCEPGKYVKGRWQTFDYKMVNALIQGSAADCTKEAMIRFARAKKAAWKILLTVHDELVISVPVCQGTEAMEVLKATMNSIEFDVPMLSDGSYSLEHWNALSVYDHHGTDSGHGDFLEKTEGGQRAKKHSQDNAKRSAA